MSNTASRKGSAIAGGTPALIDFGRTGWFDPTRGQEAFAYAGPESITVSQQREHGNDLSVVATGMVPMVDPKISFWDEVGLPVSPDVRVGFGRGKQPPGFRLNIGVYDKRFNIGGRYDGWADMLEKTRKKGDFNKYCEDNGFENLVPWTERYAAGERPTAAQILELLKRSRILWFKPEEEILDQHRNIRVENEAQAEAAIAVMDGAAFVIQQHVEGDSFAVGFEIVEDEDGTVRILRSYCGKELVENGFQYALVQLREYAHLWDKMEGLTQHYADKGYRGLISWGVMYDSATGKFYVIDPNLRKGGGHSVAMLGEKMVKLAGTPTDVVDEFYYAYVQSKHYSGPEILERILDSRRDCPNLETGEGLYPVGVKPDGRGKYAVFGSDARVRFEKSAEWHGLYVPQH